MPEKACKISKIHLFFSRFRICSGKSINFELQKAFSLIVMTKKVLKFKWNLLNNWWAVSHIKCIHNCPFNYIKIMRNNAKWKTNSSRKKRKKNKFWTNRNSLKWKKRRRTKLNSLNFKRGSIKIEIPVSVVRWLWANERLDYSKSATFPIMLDVNALKTVSYNWKNRKKRTFCYSIEIVHDCQMARGISVVCTYFLSKFPQILANNAFSHFFGTPFGCPSGDIPCSISWKNRTHFHQNESRFQSQL